MEVDWVKAEWVEVDQVEVERVEVGWVEAERVEVKGVEVKRVEVEWVEVPVMEIIGRICHFCDLKRNTCSITDESFKRKAQMISYEIQLWCAIQDKFSPRQNSVPEKNLRRFFCQKKILFEKNMSEKNSLTCCLRVPMCKVSCPGQINADHH